MIILKNEPLKTFSQIQLHLMSNLYPSLRTFQASYIAIYGIYMDYIATYIRSCYNNSSTITIISLSQIDFLVY